MRIAPYLRLMRLHQPVGIWLLLWPCWWAITAASPGAPPVSVLLLFALGAILMRSAGCIINDIADRDFDPRVERTATRPLASGELSLRQALMLLFALLALSLVIALMLGKIVLMWAALSLPLIAVYPLMKRITWWPQLFLGLTFNWGALIGWAAARGGIEWTAVVLYAGCMFWTLGYDTIYAHQDKKDDARIGVRSSALRLGENTRRAVGLFYLLALGEWLLAGSLAGHGAGFYAMLAIAGMHFFWQLRTVDFDDPASCRKIFVSNIHIGLIVWLGFMAKHI